ncbi:MAG: trypsin-like serine protease [Candidatus Kapabacteria bacterium]|nr:trypsin-like serine protease [Candidatus Kapabacteria bacterium]
MKFSLKFLLVLVLVVFLISPVVAADIKDDGPELQIIGGVNADIEDYPWQIAIFTVDADGNLEEQMCGGSIIDPFWILTAAHCVLEDAHKTQKIVAHITRRSQPDQGQVIEISDYIIHEGFDTEIIQNDVALLRLAYPIDTSKFGSKPIRLLSPDEEQNGLISPGTMATTTGWGMTTYGGDASEWLQVTSLPIISLETANQWFSETNVPIEVTTDMLPCGYEEGGKSSCHGDSGGPLFVKDNTDTWALAGITSWGAICAGVKQPAVYTRVPYFYDWIISHSKLGIDDVPTENDYVENVRMIIPKNVYSCDDYTNFGDVLIRNMGLNDLSSFEIIVKTGSSPDNITKTESQVITLEKSLPPMGSKRIPLPNIHPDDVGRNYIEVELSKPNGNNVVPNSSKGQYFNYSGITPLVLSIDLEEVSQLEIQVFSLDNESSKSLATFMSDDAGKKHQFDNCLPEGEYHLFIDGDAKGSFEMKINHEGTDYLIGESFLTDYLQFNLTLPFVPSYDIVVEIPTDLENDTTFVCDINEFNNVEYLLLYNIGSLPNQNITIRTTINGVVSDSLLDGKLFYQKYIGIPLDKSKWRIGENTIRFEVVDYDNIESDLNPENNFAERKFHIVETPQIATIEWKGDDYHWSKSFYILNSKGEIVMMQDELPEDSFDYTVCLPDGCYTFIPIDYFEEEATNETALVMKRMDGSIIFEISGQDFVTGKIVDFCTSPTSVEDYSPEKLLIYPNPASEYIEINATINPTVNRRDDESFDINIFTTLGEIVMTAPSTVNYNGSGNQSVRIDISHLPTGLYFVRIGDRFEKFVKY